MPKDYAFAVISADPERIAPWLTATCPECGEVAASSPYPHLLLPDGSVVVGCEGYHVISPEAVGLPLGGWQDWRS